MALIKTDICSGLSLYFCKLETFVNLSVKLIRELAARTISTDLGEALCLITQEHSSWS